jgi:hypothetical protein
MLRDGERSSKFENAPVAKYCTVGFSLEICEIAGFQFDMFP